MNPRSALLLHTDPAATKPLADFLSQHGARVQHATSAADARRVLSAADVDLVCIDLHLPGDDWLAFLRETRHTRAALPILITSQYPDLRRELQAKELGCHTFLRQPFEPAWIQRALDRLSQGGAAPKEATALPAVRFSLRAKIILPFALLALVFAAAAAYLVGLYVTDSLQERFDRQLVDAAALTADGVVRVERRLLEVQRLTANVTGVAEALEAGDSQGLRELALPVAVNNQTPALELLDRNGVSVLSLRQSADVPGGYAATQGDAVFVEWPFVKKVLGQAQDPQGDKYAGVVNAPWGLWLYVAGPVWGADGKLAGVVLAGQSLDALARELRTSTLAHITFYDLAGRPLASTLPPTDNALPANVLASLSAGPVNNEIYLRPLEAETTSYSEALAGWTARNGETLGWVGTGLARNFVVQPAFLTQAQSLALVLAGLAMVGLIGWVLAQHITRPLGPMVQAARTVSQGDLKVKLQGGGDDEVAVLVQAFNQMVSGLQEGSMYRDLLGRAVSPEVREEMRTSFESGNLRLEGQSVTASVLISDIQGFTKVAEKYDPAVVLQWLNEYFGELVPVITAHGGVVDKFEGDAILAFFGVLPRPLPAEESARQACQAALEMLKVVAAINQRRQSRGEPAFLTGIGVNTGPVTAGGLGTADRLNYTVIGDTVNTTQRLETFTRAFGGSAAVISETTRQALGGQVDGLRLDSVGRHQFKGKSDLVEVFRLQSAEDAAS